MASKSRRASAFESGNPLYRSDVPLECGILADILGLFLRCDPSTQEVFLPIFRLEQLCECVTREIKYDGDAMESIGSLYALCLYLTYAATLDSIPRENIGKIIYAIEACTCECLAFMAEKGNCDVDHPLKRISQQRRYAQAVNGFKYVTFSSSLEQARVVLKGIIKQIRKARDEVDVRTYKKQKFMQDGFQPHSIYFMCIFALAHVVAVSTLDAEVKVVDFPGLMETMALASVVRLKNDEQSDLSLEFEKIGPAKSQGAYSVKADDRDPNTCEACLKLSADLAFSVLDTIDSVHFKASNSFICRHLREMTKISDNYARMQVARYEKFSKEGEHDITARKDIIAQAGKVETSDKRTLYSHDRRKQDFSGVLCIGRPCFNKFKHLMEAESSKESAITSLSFESGHVDREKELTKEERIFQRLHPRFQNLYSIMNVFTLKKIKTLNSTLKLPKVDTKAAVSPFTVAVSNLESLFMCLDGVSTIPRILDTTESQFWVSHFLDDLIISKECTGVFLCRVHETKKRSLRQDIHLITNKVAIPGSVAEVFIESEADILKEELSGKGKGSPPPKTPNRLKTGTVQTKPSPMILSDEKLNEKLKPGNSLFNKLQFAKAAAKAEFDLQEVITENEKFQRLKEIKSSKKATKHTSQNVSKIWTDIPIPPKDRTLAAFATVGDAFNVTIPREVSMRYASKILESKDHIYKAEMKRKEDMEISQELELGKIRTSKLLNLREALEERRAEKTDSLSIKSAKDEEEKELRKLEKARRKEEKEQIKIREEKEIFRQHQLEQQAMWLKLSLERENAERAEFDKIRVKSILNKKEFEEQIRRNEEEDRMRVLEERQRRREGKKLEEEMKRHVKIKSKQDAVEKETLRHTIDVRRGIFKWQRGKYSFYRQVRRKEVPWVQYEDENGNFYYYDSITNKTQYKVPVDAPFINYKEVERLEYEKVNGAGSWDVLLADRAWKDEAMRNGGYFDDKGRWKTLRGYWDENYEWVDMSHGYYNSNGEFILHHVTGDLDFMV